MMRHLAIGRPVMGWSEILSLVILRLVILRLALCLRVPAGL